MNRFILMRAIQCAVLVLPCTARAQFSLMARQVGPDAPADGTTYNGICARDACRATLLLYLPSGPCVLNVRVSAPNAFGAGEIAFAAGPCRGGFSIKMSADTANARYLLDQFGATTSVFRLEFVPRTSSAVPDDPPGFNDGVVRPGVAVELGIVATNPL